MVKLKSVSEKFKGNPKKDFFCYIHVVVLNLNVSVDLCGFFSRNSCKTVRPQGESPHFRRIGWSNRNLFDKSLSSSGMF